MKTILLTNQQKKEYQEKGYLVIKNLIAPEEVNQLRADYDRAVSGEIKVPEFAGNKKKGKVVQLQNPSQYIPGWKYHVYFQKAWSVARQLGGDDIEYGYDQIIFKPEGATGETAWHQDAAYWKKDRSRQRALTCWLALSPAFKENGCMQFVPGSHLGEIQEHARITEKSEITEALETKVDPSRAVVCPLEAGDASFHHCRTLHYTGGNFSDVPRRGLITHFFAKD